jgi:hypothetical protein
LPAGVDHRRAGGERRQKDQDMTVSDKKVHSANISSGIFGNRMMRQTMALALSLCQQREEAHVAYGNIE